MTIYGYARVSTQEQSVEYDALKQQIQRLKDAGADIVVFDIESGRSNKRKEFLELIRLAEKGKVREIIVTRIDRLGRSVITISKTIEMLNIKNVKLRILDAPVDSGTAFGWLSINQMAGLAEFESRMLSERTRHGMNYFRDQKKVQSAPFGYLKEDHKLILDKSKYIAARKIIELLLSGYSYGHISKVLFTDYQIKFSLSGLRHWINNPAICGHIRYFSEVEQRRNANPRPPVVHRNCHDAIATDEEIAQIKSLTKTKPRLSEKETKNYPLKGLCKCAVCGAGMYRIISRFKSGNTEYIRCTKHSQNVLFCTNKTNARLTNVQKQIIEALIKKSSEILKEINLAKMPSETESKILIDLRDQLAGLKALKSTNPAIVIALKDLQLQILAEENREPSLPSQGQDTELLYSFSQATFWESRTDEDLRKFLGVFVESVSIDSSGDVSEIKFSR
jgi:site-specific DNA recombinase